MIPTTAYSNPDLGARMTEDDVEGIHDFWTSLDKEAVLSGRLNASEIIDRAVLDIPDLVWAWAEVQNELVGLRRRWDAVDDERKAEIEQGIRRMDEVFARAELAKTPGYSRKVGTDVLGESG